MKDNPLAGALFWEGSRKPRINSGVVTFEPCMDTDEADNELAGHRVSVNGQEVGTLLFDPDSEKHFRLEPILDRKTGEAKGHKRSKGQKSLEKAALDMFEHRMKAEYEAALA